MWGNPIGKVDLWVEKLFRGINTVFLLEFLLVSPKISALCQLFTDHL